MVDVVRYAEKFENSSGSVTQTFPDSNVVYTPRQDYRGAWAAAVGADYAHLFSGSGVLTKEVGFEDISGMIWGTSGSNADSQFDALAAKCKSIGLGKLYVIDQAGARRWCWAISLGRPGYQADPNSLYNIPYTLRFARFSDWFDTSSTAAGPTAVATNYESFTITNPGNAYVKTGFVLTLIATAEAGFSKVIVTNVTTSEQIRWNGSSRSVSTLVINNSDLSVKMDPDVGLVIGGSDSYVGEGGIGGPGIYTDEYPLVTLGPTQPGLITLAPGANTIVIQVDGTASYTRTYTFNGAWE